MRTFLIGGGRQAGAVHEAFVRAAGGPVGTLYRLVHALIATNVAEGWAIDEDTGLKVADDMVTVHGSGTATRVRCQGPDVNLAVHVAGDQVPVR